MKKNYMKPTINVVNIRPTCFVCESVGNGDGVYGNKSASGANQLSRQSSDWDDE